VDWFTGRQGVERLENARKLLLPGETLLDSAIGMVFLPGKTKRPGAMLITDRRVVLYAVKLGGHEALDFAYSLLTSVDHSKGLTWTTITLAAAGSSARMSVPKADVDRFITAIRDQLAASARPADPTADVDYTASGDVSNDIRAVAVLRDDGLITEEEYQQKKRQLLGL
jgi:hypothetical protein